MSVKKKKSKAVARAIANLVQDDDMENQQPDETAAKVSDDSDQEDEDMWKLDFEMEDHKKVEKSVLRVNAGMPDLTLSEGRYKGKKATRKSLSGKPDDEDEEYDKGGLSIDEKEHAEAELGYLLEGGSEDDDEESDQEEEEEEEEQDVSEEESIEDNVERDEEDDWEDVENTSQEEDTEEADKSEHKEEKKSIKLKKERLKGRQIKQQQEIGEQLIELRIQVQKIVSLMNQLPQVDVFDDVKTASAGLDGEDVIKESSKAAKASLISLLGDIMGAKGILTSRSGGIDPPEEEESPPKRKKLKHFSQALATDFDSAKTGRNATIEKWNDKTQLATASKSGAAGSGFSGFELSIVKQISHILSENERLVRRTQLKRSHYNTVGKEAAAVNVDHEEDQGDDAEFYDEEIFDDDDFYHTLLRDLVDKKAGEGAGSGGGDLAQKVAQIQKLRSKSKRKVDTRASKGRRIRYDIHAKLVNFTAPVAGVSTISEEARNELFGSLFK